MRQHDPRSGGDPPVAGGDDSTIVELSDGQAVVVRPIRADDHDRLVSMWQRLSAETIRLRFFGPVALDADLLGHLIDVNSTDRFALVAEVPDRIIGVARFDRLPEDPATADFAITVEDAEQGRGLGTALLQSLLKPARERGITAFHGEILKQNEGMLAIMRVGGFAPAIRDYGEMVSATFTTTPTEALLARAGAVGRPSVRQALLRLFRPDAIAVVGAGRRSDSVGHLMLRHLLSGGFSGAVYPVNPHASHVHSVAAYPTLTACPTIPDTVIVCVPAPLVGDVLEEAGQLGVGAAVLVGSGFSESGTVGAALEEEVREVAQRHGIRLIGPNSMGVLNADSTVRMNGTLSPILPGPGRVGLSSQSGALGSAILAEADRMGLGLSTFASIGHKVDISSNDLLQYWEADEATDVILLYLESFGNPRTFARVARRVGRTKPIVAVKAGRRGTDDVVVQAMFDQTGVVRVPTLNDMLNVASLLSSQPLPAGPHVGIVSNGAGPAALATDACLSHGLQVGAVSEGDRDDQTGEVPANPRLLRADADAADYATAIAEMASTVDVLLAIYTPSTPGEAEAVADAIAEASTDLDIPLITVFMSFGLTPSALRTVGVPIVAFPEAAADAIGHAVRYAQWRRQPLGQIVAFHDVDVLAAAELLAGGLDTAVADPDDGGRGRWLGVDDTRLVLQAHGIRLTSHRVVATPEDAGAAQQELGVPVVVKPAAPVRKTALGAVRLGLTRPDQVADAVRTMTQHLRRDGHDDVLQDGWQVQQMVPDGVEMTISVGQDPTFGPVIEVGLGGTMVELLGDRSVKVLPLTDTDARDMVHQLRGYPLLAGYRGSSAVDVPALQALLLRLAALIEAHPTVDRIELDPVFVRRHGVQVVDARIGIQGASVPTAIPPTLAP